MKDLCDTLFYRVNVKEMFVDVPLEDIVVIELPQEIIHFGAALVNATSIDDSQHER